MDGVEGGGLAPGHWTPGAGKGGDEEAGEHDHDDACRGRPRRIDSVQSEMAHAGENDETHGHPETAKDEALAVAEVLYKVQARKRAGDVDGTDDDLRHVAIRNSRGSENGRAVIKEEIGAGQLLKREDGDAK